MKNLDEIIEAYRLDGHKVDGLYLKDVQKLPESEILAILENSEGKDIIIDDKGEDDDIRDGQSWKYDGDADPKFVFWDLL